MATGRRGAVFLDRDGTLVEDRDYLADPAGVRLLAGAAGAVARLNAAGVPVILVTNQSGIGRGFFGEGDYAAVHDRLVELLRAAGARLDGEYHCPDAPHGPASGCRKPAPGMFLRAAEELGIDLAASWYVGDRMRDVTPAREWGGTGILVRSRQSELDAAEASGEVEVVNTLAEAVDRFLAVIQSASS